jgi:hypothetical protein
MQVSGPSRLGRSKVVASSRSEAFHGRYYPGSESRRHDIGYHQHLFVRHRRKIGLRVGDDEVFGLGTINGIAESPTTGDFPAVLIISAIIRMHAAQAGAAESSWGHGAAERAIAFCKAFYCRAEFFDDSYWFVANGKTRCDRILAFADVNVRSANGGSGYPEQGIVRADFRNWFLAQFDTAGPDKHGRLHSFGHKILLLVLVLF